MGNRGQQGVQVEAALPCARKSWAPSQSSASHRREEKRICLQGPCHSLSGSLIKWQSPPANLWSVPLLRNVYQIEPLLLVGPCPSPQVPRETSQMVRHSVPRAFTSLYLLTKLYEAVTEPVLHSQRVCAQSLSRARFFAPFWTVAHQAPLSMGFSRQEYWSGLPFPSPGDPPNLGTEPVSLVSPALQVDSLPVEPSDTFLKALTPFSNPHSHSQGHCLPSASNPNSMS